MSNYEPDSLDEVPTITLERALAQIKDGTIPPEYDKCLILLVDNDGEDYNVRTFSCGFINAEVIGLLEAEKYRTLKHFFREED